MVTGTIKIYTPNESSASAKHEFRLFVDFLTQFFSLLFFHVVTFVRLFIFFLENKAVGIIKPGHVFTVEPMINQGTFLTAPSQK